MNLPVLQIMPSLLDVLRQGSNAVLVAPPGAGKTTAVAPALLDQPWCTGQVILLSPRRIAARAAAERMAALAGEDVGGSIGYVTRLDSRHGPRTRLLVMTQGIFRNRIQDDPELSGVSAVLFDEVHERSLDSDFGLALALDAQGGLRPDLRLIAMSATLDGERFAALMGDAPVIESEGRSHPLELRHVGRRTELPLEQDMAQAIRRALAEEGEGDLLAFLPGVREIERTAQLLEQALPDMAVHPLHGTLDPARQQTVLRPDREGRRKLILATSIAETSLTIDGVRIVVDCGLSRRPRYDRRAGITRLSTERVSQASATQRAGRAARQYPGVAYRLWEEAATAGLAPYDPPQILEADLSGLLLDCARWGVTDPGQLAWLDPPPAAAISEARRRLTSLGAMDADGRITAHGRDIAALPLEPRIAHMMIAAAEAGLPETASQVALLLGERGLGGQGTDLSRRVEQFARDKGRRAAAARGTARNWQAMVRNHAGRGEGADSDHPVGLCLALAFPDRVSRRRGADGADWISVGGRGFRLDPLDPLAREEWLAVGEVQGVSAGARIIAAAPLSATEVEYLFADRIETVRHVRYRPQSASVEAVREVKLGAVTLRSGPDDSPDPAAVTRCLRDAVARHGLDLLPWSESARRLRRRAAHAGMEALSDAALLGDLDDWLAPLLEGRRGLSAIKAEELAQALDLRLGWEGRKQIEERAPERLHTPAGSSHVIDYDDPGGPSVEVRVQALFGLSQHPVIGVDRLPLRLLLTSPAGRPIQTTLDLPGFWAGSWRDVVKEMRGRYPKHAWPDDPAAATATLRTKKAAARQES